MAFCPDCEAEYREGIKVCPDCGVELVAELTSENLLHDKNEGEPVPLQSFKTSAEAELVSNLLSENDIRCFVQGGDFAVIPGSFSQEVVLMVDERDISRAIQLYEAYFDAESPAPTIQERNEDK